MKESHSNTQIDKGMIVIAILFLAGLIVLGLAAISYYENYVFQEEHCHLNPHNYQVGDMIRVKVSGNKAQVLELASYYSNNVEKSCQSNGILVRVATHGIANDGGHWNSAKPEVLPDLRLQTFETEPWSE
jgi:hypothetical protein